MNKLHQEILKGIKARAGEKTAHSGNDSYLSSGHHYYEVSNPVKRKIIKDFKESYPNLTFNELTALVISLNKARSYEEKTCGSLLLEYYPKLRARISPEVLDQLLDELKGWAEVDSLCQGIFTNKEMLSEWTKWEKLLKKLNRSENINKRRTSLVFLTGVVGKSEDPRLSKLAFGNIDNLKRERDILITKAISWLLRDLTKLHRREVEKYLKDRSSLLPAIAVRETRNKLQTGKK